MHPLDDKSPLHGETQETLAEKQLEIIAVLTGVDETSSQSVTARYSYVAEDLRFGHRFEDIIGATPDGRLSHKPELIGEALRRLTLAPATCWMIGDRHMDIDGARHHGMRSVGVLWGFGGEDELREAGATHLVASPAQLQALFA